MTTVADRFGPRPAHTGVLIGIATIAMSFAALTSALVVRQSGAADWQHFRLPPILYVNTVLLLFSSATLEAARRGGGAGRGRVPWLGITLALGGLFVLGQILAWRALAAQGLFLATSPSSAFFYVLTALHGLHVSGGMAALSYVLVRARRVSPPHAAVAGALGAAALYWHFMAALWLYVLTILVTRI